MNQSLFDKYGGVPVVTGIVRDFYKRALRRPNLRRYFMTMDRKQLSIHHAALVALAMGKPPPNYDPQTLHEAHLSVAVTGTSFDLMVTLLVEAMASAGVSLHDRAEVRRRLVAVRSEIVSR